MQIGVVAAWLRSLAVDFKTVISAMVNKKETTHAKQQYHFDHYPQLDSIYP